MEMAGIQSNESNGGLCGAGGKSQPGGKRGEAKEKGETSDHRAFETGGSPGDFSGAVENSSTALRAGRAKPKFRRDDAIVAQGNPAAREPP